MESSSDTENVKGQSGVIQGQMLIYIHVEVHGHQGLPMKLGRWSHLQMPSFDGSKINYRSSGVAEGQRYIALSL